MRPLNRLLSLRTALALSVLAISTLPGVAAGQTAATDDGDADDDDAPPAVPLVPLTTTNGPAPVLPPPPSSAAPPPTAPAAPAATAPATPGTLTRTRADDADLRELDAPVDGAAAPTDEAPPRTSLNDLPPAAAVERPVPDAEIIVTASRSRQRAFDAAQNVTVVTRRDIEQRVAGTAPDALFGAAGVHMQWSNPGGGSPFLRGFTGKQILMLVDGIRLNNGALSRGGPTQYLNTVDVTSLDRIETVFGPGSVLYGSDALGGVINLISRRRTTFEPGIHTNTEVAGRASSAEGAYRGSLRSEGNIDNFGWVIGGSYQSFGELQGGRRVGTQSPTGWQAGGADARLQYRIDGGHEVSVSWQSYLQRDVPKSNETILNRAVKFDYQPQDRHMGAVDYRYRSPEGYVREAQVTLSWQRQIEGIRSIARRPDPLPDGFADVLRTERTNVDTVGLTGFVLLDFGKWSRLTPGVDAYFDWVNTWAVQRNLTSGNRVAARPGFPDGTRYSTLGVFVQDVIAPVKGLELTLGGRYTRNQIDSRWSAAGPDGQARTVELSGTAFNNLSFSGNASYTLFDVWKLTAGVSQGFRAPNVEDLAIYRREDAFWVVPNPGLRPERSLNVEVGTKLAFAGLNLGAYYYHAWIDDLIARAPVPDEYFDANGNGTRDDGELPLAQYQNVRRAQIDGVEARADFEMKGWGVGGNLTYTYGRDQARVPLRRMPPLQGRMFLRYRDPDGLWYVEALADWAQPQRRVAPGDVSDTRIGPGGTRGYFVTTLRGGVRPIAFLELNLAVQNITDAKWKTHGSGIYGPGFNFLAETRIRF